MFGGSCRDSKTGARTPCAPNAFQAGGTPGGGMFPFSNSAPAPGPLGPITPPFPFTTCRDNMTPVPFSVISPNTLPVSGGGAALAGVLAGAPPGSRLLILDSLNYDPITITGMSNLTIEADAGQTPSITAAFGDFNSCVKFGDGNSGIALRGLTFIGNGNATGNFANTIQQTEQGLVNCPGTVSTLMRVIIEDCTFIEPMATVAQGAPGIQIIGASMFPGVYHDVWVHRCTFIDNGCSLTATNPSGYGALTIAGFTGVYIQNCQILRDNAVILRAVSPMRGVVVKGQVIIENVYCNDIGTGGGCENFYAPPGSQFGSAPGQATFRNCISYNGRFGFAVDSPTQAFKLNACVYACDILGITATAIFRVTVGVMQVINTVIKGAGDGFAFTPAGVFTENHNNVFNFGSNGIALDPTDITSNPLLEDIPNGDFIATSVPAQTAALDGGPVGVRYPGGEKIIYCNH